MKVLRKAHLSNPIVGVHSIGFDRAIDLDVDRTVLTSQFNLISGWSFRCHKLVDKYADEIRASFRLSPRYEGALKFYFKENIQEEKTVVGVHIRRGD